MTDVTSLILNRMKKTPSVHLSVQRTMPHSREVATVLMTVGPAIKRAADLDDAVATCFDNRVRVLPGSAYRAGEGRVIAVLAANKPTRPCTEEASFSDLTAMSATVFHDKTDAIWRKHGEGDAAMLIKDATDDLSSILDMRRALSIDTASVGVKLNEKCKVGQAIGWYDANGEQFRVGIVTALGEREAAAFCYDGDKPLVITFDPTFVNVVTDEGLTSTETAGLAPSVFGRESAPLSRENMLQKHIAYMQVLYGKRKDYFDRLVALIRRGYGASAMA